MKKSYFIGNGNPPMKMNLQFFADGDSVDTGEDEGDGADTRTNDATAAKQTKPKSFDELLTEGNHQAEFERRLQEALENQKSRLEVLFNDKATEAEKLAKMTKEEKTQYMQHKQEQDLADREAAITRRELMAEAKNTLAEKKLPVELAEVLSYTDASSCSKSIEWVEKAFQKAVEAAVEERLKGGKPPKIAPGQEETNLAKQVEQIMMGV